MWLGVGDGQPGRSAGTGWGQNKIKVPDTTSCLRLSVLFVFPCWWCCGSSESSDEEFASLPQSPTPTGHRFGDFPRAAKGTCPRHLVGGTGRQQPPMRREGEKETVCWRLPFPLKMVRVFPDLRARLSLSTRPFPRTIKRACHRSHPEPCAFLHPRPSRFEFKKELPKQQCTPPPHLFH